MCVDGVLTHPYTSLHIPQAPSKVLVEGSCQALGVVHARSVWPQEKVVRSIGCEGLRTWSVQAIMLVDVFRMVKN